ncbi:hypothetical protein GCM10010299_46480 [Streptomyces tanashiensis]|nr:hypothetical protein GCM10010299_46480 [Streptomyces tanashiensis]
MSTGPNRIPPCPAPVRWLMAQRLEPAEYVLETTVLPIALVAHRIGLGSGSPLRAHMRTDFGIPPAA